MERFARMIVSCSMHSHELFMAVAGTLNYDATRSEFSYNDFSDNTLGLVFSAMQAYSAAYVKGNPWPADPIQWIQAVMPHLDLFFKSNPEYPESYKKAAVQMMVTLPPPAMGEHDRVCDGLVDYVLGIRYAQAELRTLRTDPGAKRKVMEEVPRTVRSPGGKEIILDSDVFLSNLIMLAVPSKPFYTGVASFDNYYGKRARGGDAWLAFGHTGGGKTILACQTAGFTAAHGKYVMYITTEVDAPILYFRAFSATTETAYDMVKGISGSGGNHPLIKEFSDWKKYGPGSRITVFSYRELDGANYKEKLLRALDLFVKHHGRPPDMSIWDWVGGALDSGFTDAWQKTEAYNGVAATMSNLANELDAQTMTLAQADKATKNKANLIESDTRDSKALADPMEGALGITSLLETGDVSGEGSGAGRDVHKIEQFWCIPKCREEHTLRLKVFRRFSYARFESGGPT
jgi:hypothetical protein